MERIVHAVLPSSFSRGRHSSKNYCLCSPLLLPPCVSTDYDLHFSWGYHTHPQLCFQSYLMNMFQINEREQRCFHLSLTDHEFTTKYVVCISKDFFFPKLSSKHQQLRLLFWLISSIAAKSFEVFEDLEDCSSLEMKLFGTIKCIRFRVVFVTQTPHNHHLIMWAHALRFGSSNISLTLARTYTLIYGTYTHEISLGILYTHSHTSNITKFIAFDHVENFEVSVGSSRKFDFEVSTKNLFFEGASGVKDVISSRVNTTHHWILISWLFFFTLLFFCLFPLKMTFALEFSMWTFGDRLE